MYVTLYNVIDIRTNKFHSVAKVKERMVRFFIPAVQEEEPEEEPVAEVEAVAEPEVAEEPQEELEPEVE